jgi:hypothetical protein
MLVAAPDGEVVGDRAVSKSRVLTTLARRSLPSLLEATVVPALIFYVFLLRAGPGPAMVSVLVWSYGAVIRRLAGGHRIPSILMLAVLGLTVRTVVGFTSGTFMYFLQPVVGTLGLQPGVISLGLIKRGAVERDHAGGFATEVVGNGEVSEVTPLPLPHTPDPSLTGIEDLAVWCRPGRCGAFHYLALR